MITAVLTSCRRHGLLDKTLRSFFATQPTPLKRVIVVEDGPDIPQELRRTFAGEQIEWISTGESVGQIVAIDYAYSRVDTPYVFHLEDDWLFYRAGFLDGSLRVLQGNPKCLQVHLRALKDFSERVDAYAYSTDGVQWR